MKQERKTTEIKIGSFQPVTHTCNPNHSGGRDQEIVVQSQPEQIVPETLFQKTHHTKGWWSGSRYRP
jgi:hypothetical protein